MELHELTHTPKPIGGTEASRDTLETTASLIVATCLDPFGRSVLLTLRRWEDHILDEHAELTDQLSAVRSMIEQPDEVRFDTTYGNRASYYRLGGLPPPYDRLYLKVCAEFGPANALGQESIGVVVTAFPLRRPKAGEVHRWP